MTKIYSIEKHEDGWRCPEYELDEKDGFELLLRCEEIYQAENE